MAMVDYAQLTYLVLLASALVFWMLLQNRRTMGRGLQQLAAWALIFLGVVAAYGLWEDIRQTVAPSQAVFAEDGRIELPRAPDGHYYATLDVNGVPVRFVVDTGATAVVLTRDAAERAGFDSSQLMFFSEAMTANGAVRTAPVSLDAVALGPFVDRSVPAYVNAGEMETSLLGMTYLQRFDRLEIARGTMVLER